MGSYTVRTQPLLTACSGVFPAVDTKSSGSSSSILIQGGRAFASNGFLFSSVPVEGLDPEMESFSVSGEKLLALLQLLEDEEICLHVRDSSVGVEHSRGVLNLPAHRSAERVVPICPDFTEPDLCVKSLVSALKYVEKFSSSEAKRIEYAILESLGSTIYATDGTRVGSAQVADMKCDFILQTRALAPLTKFLRTLSVDKVSHVETENLYWWVAPKGWLAHRKDTRRLPDEALRVATRDRYSSQFEVSSLELCGAIRRLSVVQNMELPVVLVEACQEAMEITAYSSTHTPSTERISVSSYSGDPVRARVNVGDLNLALTQASEGATLVRHFSDIHSLQVTSSQNGNRISATIGIQP